MTFPETVEAVKTLGYPVVTGLLFWFALRGDAKEAKAANKETALQIQELHKKVDTVLVLEAQHYAAMQAQIQNNADRNYKVLRTQAYYQMQLVQLMGNRRGKSIVPPIPEDLIPLNDDDAEVSALG